MSKQNQIPDFINGPVHYNPLNCCIEDSDGNPIIKVIGTNKVNGNVVDQGEVLDKVSDWLVELVNDWNSGLLMTINEQMEALKSALHEQLVEFDSEQEKMDFILDILNEYKIALEKR